jgi:hypothetical protein
MIRGDQVLADPVEGGQPCDGDHSRCCDPLLGQPEVSTGEGQLEGFMRVQRKAAEWSIFPYGWATEGDGSLVLFDRKYRPICRKYPDGRTELMRSDAFIEFAGRTWLYDDCSSPVRDAGTRKLVLAEMERWGVRDELKRRRELQRRKALPSWDGVSGKETKTRSAGPSDGDD